jgi:hypothetical protein
MSRSADSKARRAEALQALCARMRFVAAQRFFYAISRVYCADGVERACFVPAAQRVPRVRSPKPSRLPCILYGY